MQGGGEEHKMKLKSQLDSYNKDFYMLAEFRLDFIDNEAFQKISKGDDTVSFA